MTLCANGSSFTKETRPAGGIVRIVGVGQASISSTVSPAPWVPPEWQPPPPAAAGIAGASRTGRAVSAITNALRGATVISSRVGLNTVYPPDGDPVPGGGASVHRSGDLERRRPVERGLEPVGDAVHLPDQDVASDREGLGAVFGVDREDV